MRDKAYCILFAVSLFRGSASTWWQTVIETYGEDTIDKWQDFIQLAEEQFGSRDNHQRARDEMARVRQERSVEEYMAQFMATNECPKMLKPFHLKRYQEHQLMGETAALVNYSPDN